jgi:hypothetical protein
MDIVDPTSVDRLPIRPLNRQTNWESCNELGSRRKVGYLLIDFVQCHAIDAFLTDAGVLRYARVQGVVLASRNPC